MTNHVYDLAQPLGPHTPVSANHCPFRMALARRHQDRLNDDGSATASELFVMGTHTGTHLDAPCHVSYRGILHGGIAIDQAMEQGHFRILDVASIEPIVCRGVLLDVARLRGVASLPPAEPVTSDDLEATAAAQGIVIGDGDGVLIRTGWPQGRWDRPREFVGWKHGVPGPDLSAARWLAAHGVRVVGSDTIAFERVAPGNPPVLPVHLYLLFERGIPILEVLDLEALAADQVWEFELIAAPLRIVGATGAPLRPLALVRQQDTIAGHKP